MSDHMFALDKQTGVNMVGVGETWWQSFAKYVLKVLGPESTHTCKYERICAGLQAGTDGAVHGVKYIWDSNSTKKIGVF